VLVDLPARTQPQGEATVGDVVDGGRSIGQQRRMMDRGGGNQRPEGRTRSVTTASAGSIAHASWTSPSAVVSSPVLGM
jgi:hypothetical protein